MNGLIIDCFAGDGQDAEIKGTGETFVENNSYK